MTTRSHSAALLPRARAELARPLKSRSARSGRIPGLGEPDPSWFSALRPEDAHVRLRYLGTAGFVLEHEHRVIALDPFITRPSLLSSLTRRLVPDESLAARHVPFVHDVLVGHAHYDHVLDAPSICLRTGARLIGSRAVCNVGRAAGMRESRLVETAGREDIACGPITVRGLPSAHGRVFFGRVGLAGDIANPPPWPPRIGDLRHGLVLNWLVDTGHLRIVHVDSAEFLPDELRGIRADVVCLCAAGRQYRPNYVREIVTLLEPRWVVPCHWDTMFTPIDAPAQLAPGVNLPGFLDEIRAAGATPLATPLLGTQSFPALR